MCSKDCRQMQTVAQIRIGSPNGIDLIPSLQHKVNTYSAREYTADGAETGDVLVRVEGARAPIQAWIVSKPNRVDADAQLHTRRRIPASYVDYSTLQMTSQGPTRDVFITHKAFLRVDDVSSTVAAHVEACPDVREHLKTINEVCAAAKLQSIPPGVIDAVCAGCDRAPVSRPHKVSGVCKP